MCKAPGYVSGCATPDTTPWGVCARPGVRAYVCLCVRAVCECVISTAGARGSVSFSMGSFHSQHCALLFTVPESPPCRPHSLPFPSHPLCCCCERLFAFSVDSPLCLFVFDLVFVFFLIFYSLCFEVGEDFASYSATLSDLSYLDASSR